MAAISKLGNQECSIQKNEDTEYFKQERVCDCVKSDKALRASFGFSNKVSGDDLGEERWGRKPHRVSAKVESVCTQLFQECWL